MDCWRAEERYRMEQNPGVRLAANSDKTASVIESSSIRLSPPMGRDCPSGHLGTQTKCPEGNFKSGLSAFFDENEEVRRRKAGSFGLAEDTHTHTHTF